MFVCECLKTKNAGHDEESGSSRQRQTKRKRETITVEEALLPVVSHPHLLWRTCNTQTKKDYNKVLSTLYQKSPYAPYLLEWEVLNKAGCAEEMGDVNFERLVLEGERSKGNFYAAEFWKEISGEDVRVYGKKRV